MPCSADWNHTMFNIGDTVVYPHHGAAIVEAVETRTIKGKIREYLVLKVSHGDLTVRVPAENAEHVGIRDVVARKDLDQVFDILRNRDDQEPSNWSRRYKINLDKLASGNVNKIAEVVRDLWHREQEKGLSSGEKRMLAKARHILIAELSLADCPDNDSSQPLLDAALNEFSSLTP